MENLAGKSRRGVPDRQQVRIPVCTRIIRTPRANDPDQPALLDAWGAVGPIILENFGKKFACTVLRGATMGRNDETGNRRSEADDVE